MFNYLFKKYKVEVLKTSTWLSIKELKQYEKLSLVLVILSQNVQTLYVRHEMRII